MALVHISQVSKEYDGQVVLDGVDLSIERGQRAGLIGANGAGKTTLLKLIAGHERPDFGSISRARSLQIGYLSQEPQLDSQRPLLAEVLTTFEGLGRLEQRLHELADRLSHEQDPDKQQKLLDQYARLQHRFESAGGYSHETRAREVLGGLGFGPDDYDLPTKVLSGGQKCRAALAKLLLTGSELLLLDEPTNHLDMEATAWLEKFLTAHHGGLIIVSHDRYLLDRLVSKIIDLEDHHLTVYPCNYSDYVESKRIRLLDADRQYEQQQTWLKHQREYIARVKYKLDSAKQARGRQSMIERMEREGKILARPTTRRHKALIRFKPAERGGDMVLRCEGISKSYGDLVLIENLDLDLQRGQKLGVIGPNGVGKTTLLKMALGQVQPDAGHLRLYENLTIGYYDQEHEQLDLHARAIDQVWSVRPAAGELAVRSFMACFGLTEDAVFKRVADLSGGQQSRVLLARLVWTDPQVMLLDEPTNRLDIATKEVLEEALADYPGSIILVSHDRYFLDKVVNCLLFLEPGGKWRFFRGNYSEYVRRQTEAAASAAQLTEAQRQAAAQANRSKRGKPSRRKPGAPRMSLRQLEEAIIEKEEQLEQVQFEFANREVYRDAERIRQLRGTHSRLEDQLAKLNAQWEQQAEQQR